MIYFNSRIGSVEHDTAENLMKSLMDNTARLIWTDPPFGTGKKFKLGENQYQDMGPGELHHNMLVLGAEAQRALTPDGLLAVCLDYRSAHQAHQAISGFLDFHGEIIWHFETGSNSKKFWTNKHNTVLLFGRPDGTPRFNLDEVPVELRKAPKPGYPDTKPVTSVWNINMSTTDPQRVGYPSQKPLELVERFIKVHTAPGDLVVDPFAGSGTTAHAAMRLGRRFITGDINIDAVETTIKRIKQEVLNV